MYHFNHQALEAWWLFLPKRSAEELAAFAPAEPLSNHTQTIRTVCLGEWILVGSDLSDPLRRIQATSDTWQWTTDPYTLDRAWISTDPSGSPRAMGSDPVLVAAVTGQELDLSALYEDLAIGFRTDARSAFHDTMPICSQHALRITPAGITSDPPEYCPTGTDGIDALVAYTASLVDEDVAFELTGGVDSRLALALATAGGARITKAFTIGEPRDADVITARAIAQQLNIEHRIVCPTFSTDQLLQDGDAVARASGFACNWTAYAWLPGIFAQLDGWRSSQLSGVGGEIAKGFYYNAADPLFAHAPLSLWLRVRASVEQERWSGLFRPEARRSHRREVLMRISSMLSQRPWRSATDAYYAGPRMIGWAVPALRASSIWYEPRCPFLSPAYIAWSRTLREEDRENRRAQLELIQRLTPDLARFTTGIDAKTSDSKLKKKIKKIRRIGARLTGASRGSATGSAQTSEALLANASRLDELHEFVEMHPELDRDFWRKRIWNNPATAAHAVGAVATFQVAASALRRESSYWLAAVRQACKADASNPEQNIPS